MGPHPKHDQDGNGVPDAIQRGAPHPADKINKKKKVIPVSPNAPTKEQSDKQKGTLKASTPKKKKKSNKKGNAAHYNPGIGPKY